MQMCPRSLNASEVHSIKNMSSETRDVDFWCSLIVGCMLGLYVLICTCMPTHTTEVYHVSIWLISPIRESVSCTDMSSSLWPHGLYPSRLLCPWDSSGKNTGGYSHSLLLGIFPTQGSNPGLLHCRQIIYCQSHRGRPCPIKHRLNLDWNLWEACSTRVWVGTMKNKPGCALSPQDSIFSECLMWKPFCPYPRECLVKS